MATAPVRKMYRLDFLSMPTPWLANVLIATQQDGMISLFRTCIKLQKVCKSTQWMTVLSFTEFSTIQAALGTPEAARSLAVAETVTSNTHLILQGGCDHLHGLGSFKSILTTAFSTAAALYRRKTGLFQQAQPQLCCITCITLSRGQWLEDTSSQESETDETDLVLDTFVPDCLILSCPNLRELTLCNLSLAASPTMPKHTCTSLTNLTMRNVTAGSTIAQQRALQQLHNLPNLKSLTSDWPDRQGSGLTLAITKCSSQLTSLTLSAFTDTLPWAQTPDPVRFSSLRYVILHDCTIQGEALMKQLVTAVPGPAHLQLKGFTELTRGFSDHDCVWLSVTLQLVAVDQLAHLPLSSCTRLTCSHTLHLSSRDDVHMSPEQIARGVDAAQAAGGMRFPGTMHLWLWEEDAQRLQAAAPLLQNITRNACIWIQRRTTWTAAPWTRCLPLLADLGQHLRCRSADFQAGCWCSSPAAIAQLPALLPHVQRCLLTLDCRLHSTAAEQLLVEACLKTERPFNLNFKNANHEFKRRVTAALGPVLHLASLTFC